MVVESAKFNPSIELGIGDRMIKIKLNKYTLIKAGMRDEEAILEAIYVLAGTTPLFDEWVSVIDDAAFNGSDEFRGLVKRFIDAMPNALGGVIDGLKELNTGVSPVRIEGPGASLIIDIDEGRAYWEKFDYNVLEHVELREAGNGTHAVYIGERPYTLLDIDNTDSIKRAIISITGYLVAYMLGPFFTMRNAALVIANIENLNHRFRGMLNRDLELLRQILSERTGTEIGHSTSTWGLVEKIVEEALKYSWRIPFLLVHPSAEPEALQPSIMKEYSEVFTYIVIFLPERIKPEEYAAKIGLPRHLTFISSFLL